MSESENVDILTRFIEKVWNRGELAVLDQVLAPGYLVHFQGVEPGVEGYRQFLHSTLSAEPGIRFNMRDTVSSGDKVALLYTVEGLSSPYAGTALYRVEDGMLAECWAPPRQPVLASDIQALGTGGNDPRDQFDCSATEEDNLTVIKRFVDEVWNEHQVDVLDEIMRDDYLVHFVKVERGRSGYKKIWKFVRETHPDIRFVKNDFVVSGDKVVMRYNVIGVPNPFDGVVFYRLLRGKMAECWAVEPG